MERGKDRPDDLLLKAATVRKKRCFSHRPAQTAGDIPPVPETAMDVTGETGRGAPKGPRDGVGLLDEAPVGLVVFDARGFVLEASTAMSVLLGVKKECLEHVPFSRFLDDRSKKTFRLHLRALLASGKDRLCELTLLADGGNPVRSIVRSSLKEKQRGSVPAVRTAFMSLRVEDSSDDHPLGAAGEIERFADNVPDAIFRLDRGLRLMFSNRAMLDFSALSREALLDSSLDDWTFLPARLVRAIKRVARKAFRTSQSQELELTFERAGSTGCFHMRLVPEIDPGRGSGTVLGVIRDITSLKHNEEVIQTEHAFREAIGRSLSIGIGAIDDQGKQIYVNPALCRIVGWSSEELLGMYFPYVYWPADEVRKAREIFLGIRKGKKTSGSFELSLQRRDGTRFDALIMYSAFYDNSGRRIGWIGSVGDISGLKRKEKELRRLNRDLDAMVRKRTESLRVQNRNLRDILMGLNRTQDELRLSETRVLLEKQRLETILNVVPAGVIVVEGKENRIVYVNRRAQDLFGHRPSPGLEIVDHVAQLKLFRPDGRVYPDDDLPLNRSLLNGETVRGEEMVVLCPDGESVPVLVNTTPLVIGGEIAGAVGSFVDITKIKRSEESIKTLNTELAKNLLLIEDTNKELESFVQSVTHDLRSPLIVINGFSRRLLELPPESIEEKRRDYIEYIRETSENALFLIRDLLRLFKTTRGEINRTTVDLAQMSTSLQHYFRDLYPDRPITLVVHDNIRVPGDYNLLKVVMENLISNSYKFTARNDEEAIIELGSYQAEEGLVVFVRDNGCGFDMSRAGRIFEPFARFHDDSEYKGTGLGLATVKRIVHRHGGRIWAESEPGKGATFYFTLPA